MISDVLIAVGVEGALPGRDGADAYALGAPAQSFVYLATIADDEEGSPVSLSVDARPEADDRVEIDLAAAAIHEGVPVGGSFVLRWPAPAGAPDEWAMALVDRETGVTMPLGAAGEYRFTLTGPARAVAGQRRGAVPPASPMPALSSGGAGRFAVVIEPRVMSGEEPPAGADDIRGPA